MGGLARNAPALAALFLLVTLATLAMPGSPNFIGELYILFGAFDTAFVYGAVATVGVVLASVYMIRFFQRSMHNPSGEATASREIDATELALLLPAIAIVLVLAFYPQFVVDKIRPAAQQTLAGLTAEAPPR
jgi:NADH-quinone oxidoreductase subunit M